MTLNPTGWTRRQLLRNAAGAGLALGAAAALPPTPAFADDGARSGPGEKIALTDVRAFDGRTLSAPRTVVIDGGLIGISALGARTIDGGGATLLPGLRADLVLVDGDPLADIRATRTIRRIWVGGVEHAPAARP